MIEAAKQQVTLPYAAFAMRGLATAAAPTSATTNAVRHMEHPPHCVMTESAAPRTRRQDPGAEQLSFVFSLPMKDGW